jgi:hypothetical protein
MWDSSTTLHLILRRVCMYHDWKHLISKYMEKAWMNDTMDTLHSCACEFRPWQNETSRKFDVLEQKIGCQEQTTNLEFHEIVHKSVNALWILYRNAKTKLKQGYRGL